MSTESGVIGSEKTALKSVPIGAVKMRDGFWKKRMDRNHERGLPRLLAHLEEHGILDNFMIVSGRKKAARKGPYFSDSDLFKWMEGASFDLESYDDPKTRSDLDRVIDEVVAAQGDDGYLNTFFQGDLFEGRFRNLAVEHELYCAGHLFQAAVAHYRATGNDKLLDAACKCADYLDSVFGPGKRQGCSGHPEIEMALVELHRATGEKRYLDLAGYFLSQLRFSDARSLAGHAVRALYACCGGTDYLTETGDESYRSACEHLWEDLVSGKMYITGGVGSRYAREAIGEPYELPNLRAYAETCAAIANVMWNYRMLAIHGDAKFADVMERALYNGMISGVSLDGDAYFYTNPLADTGTHERQQWWECTCCPTNMVRTLASIPGLMYSVSDEGVWVNLFDNSNVEYQLADGTKFTLEQTTDYPWDGNIDIKIGLGSASEFAVHVRIPGWCRSAAAAVNHEEVGADCSPGAYVAIKRTWRPGDSIHVNLGMPVTRQECDPRVRENYGSTAVQVGPIVYCAESPDNPEVSILDLELASSDFTSSFEPELLGGVVTVKGTGLSADPDAARGPLYRGVGEVDPAKLHETPVTLIPYYAWANRGPAHMTVWIPYRKWK